MVLGFGFTLGKLAFDEWRIKRGKRNPRLHSWGSAIALPAMWKWRA